MSGVSKLTIMYMDMSGVNIQVTDYVLCERLPTTVLLIFAYKHDNVLDKLW